MQVVTQITAIYVVGIVKPEQLDACRQTLHRIEDLLTTSIRRRKDRLGNTVKSVAWAMKTKDKAKSLFDELERHKSTFQLAMSLDMWYRKPQAACNDM